MTITTCWETSHRVANPVLLDERHGGRQTHRPGMCRGEGPAPVQGRKNLAPGIGKLRWSSEAADGRAPTGPLTNQGSREIPSCSPPGRGADRRGWRPRVWKDRRTRPGHSAWAVGNLGSAAGSLHSSEPVRPIPHSRADQQKDKWEQDVITRSRKASIVILVEVYGREAALSRPFTGPSQIQARPWTPASPPQAGAALPPTVATARAGSDLRPPYRANSIDTGCVSFTLNA